MQRGEKIVRARTRIWIGLFGLGCALAASSTQAEPARNPPVRAIDFSDGINESEARAISEQLFGLFIYCGWPGPPRFTGTHWEVDTHLGRGGRPGPPIMIHVESGAVSWGARCTIEDPYSLFRRGDPPIRCTQ